MTEPRKSGPIVQLTEVDDATLQRWRDEGLLKGKKLCIRVTDEMVERAAEAAWQAWPGDDPGWSDLQSVIRPALEAALGQESHD